MKVEVLLSCMNQYNDEIIGRSNLQDMNTLMINQCQIAQDELITLDKKHRMLNSGSKGLSISRNLGIKNAIGDICVLADDDMTFYNNFENLVTDTYMKNQNADIIAFDIKNHPCGLKPKIQKLNRFLLLKISSCQISFRRDSVCQKNILFDPKIGSGTGNGAGEENKFLLECYNAGLNIYYCPITIAVLNDSDSHWFHGYDKDYFYNDGKTNRYVMGFLLGGLYCVYFLLTKHAKYKENISFWSASMSMLKGFFENKLTHQKTD